MEKLLILGNNINVDYLINCAKKRGIYVIVTDNLPIEKSPVKKLADEAWDISIIDIDGLVEKAKAEGVTGVTCGAGELAMKSVREVCKRMNLPFYVSDRAWEITNDKLLFKEECKKYRVPVAREYILDISFSEQDLAQIEYPVIVKPADGTASIGLHLCNNREELIEGYKDAYEKSAKKKVVVEKYYSGVELSFLFSFEKGVTRYVESADSYGCKKEDIPFTFVYQPSLYTERLKNELFPNLFEMFKDMECYSGVGLVQLIVENGEYVAIEMNYRLPGMNTQSHDYICQCVVDAAIPQNELEIVPPAPQRALSRYLIWVDEGTIASIEGVGKIKELPDLVTYIPYLKVGDVVKPNSGMRQIFGHLIMSCDFDKLLENVKVIDEVLSVRDENGNEMVKHFKLDDNKNVVRIK